MEEFKPEQRPKINFGTAESPKLQLEIQEAEAKRHAFNQKVVTLLEGIKDKDPEVKFNWDRIGQSEQAIAFTKKGRIVIYNNFESIVIEQSDKENITFSAQDEDKALETIQEIVDNI